jgi:hypothetical protein
MKKFYMQVYKNQVIRLVSVDETKQSEIESLDQPSLLEITEEQYSILSSFKGDLGQVQENLDFLRKYLK